MIITSRIEFLLSELDNMWVDVNNTLKQVRNDDDTMINMLHLP